MNVSIVDDILSVLDTDMALNDKHTTFMDMRKKKRGHNRLLIDIVCDMIEPYVLPLRHDEPLMIRKIEFAEKEYIQLKTIVLNSKCTYFNAVCGEALWMQKHDIEIAKKALSSYWEELSNPSVANEHIYTELTVGLCRLYSRCRVKDFDFENFLGNSIRHVKGNYDASGYGILFILNALLDCCENTEQLEKVFEDAISYYESKNILDKAIGFLEDLEEFYKKRKCTKELKAIRIRIAQDEEKLANEYDWENPEQAHIIISHIHSAMNAWSRADDKAYNAERQRLAKRLYPVKKLSLQAMKRISGEEIDLSEWIDSSKQFIEKATLESFIQQLAMIIPLKSYEDAKTDFQKKGCFFSTGLFSSVILDSNGRKKCIIPAALHASKTDMDAILENEASKSYAIYADIYLNRLLYLARRKYEFAEENLRFLVEENIFVPSNHKEAFLKGIVAGFNLDLITSMHLLMPQIEHNVRSIAQECGAVVYKTDKNGLEECLSLESILKLPEVIECLDDTFLFNIRLFYTSIYGFGMRNEVCHGLRSDSELQSADCLAVWWFTLHICCMFSIKLRERLTEQKHASIKGEFGNERI